MNTLKNKFTEYISSYCANYLKPIGAINSCEKLTPLGNIANGKYNVPGGRLNPNVDYNKVGGWKNYQWKKVADGSIYVAVDELGNLYSV